MAHLKLSLRFKTVVSASKFFFFFFLFFSVLSITTVGDDGVFMSKLLEALTPTPSGWSHNTTFCNWTGVECESNNRVTTIDLGAQSLTGTLPPDLNSLSLLTHLRLSGNALTGPLPSLFDLPLEEVHLSDNNFTSIPDSCFHGLVRLQTLYLSNNVNLAPWTFPTDLADSSYLDILHLSATNIEGTLPDIFHSLRRLRHVDLSNNNIIGDLPNSLDGSEFEVLLLNNQKVGLSGSTDVLSTMNHLTIVWLHNNEFTGTIPDLSKCIYLTDLKLDNNFLSGAVPPSLARLSSLQYLSLDNNMLRGPLPNFGNGVNATLYPINRLCPNSDGLCDQMVLLDIAEAFGNPTQLTNSWKWNDPNCQHWSFIVCEEGKVTAVKLARQSLTGTIPHEFANLTDLKNLNLSDNNLWGSIPEVLTTLHQLETLDVSYNNLSGKVPNFPSTVKLNTTGNVLFQSSEGRGTSAIGWIAGALGITVGVIMFIVIVYYRKRCLKLVQTGIFKKSGRFLNHNVDDFLQRYSSLAPKRYTYSKVKKMTKSFQHKLGQGGFGIVYKASLLDGRQVAVKVISESKGSGEEFINEVVSISRTSHVNIVSLLGFCYERNKRALIYEFMSNGSLDKFIYKRESPNPTCNLDCDTLYKIAIGIAQGLEYLHRGCSTRIVHLDIKPQNILLDEDFCPKISDFGLAKLCKKKESTVSILGTRGTIGYIAPEVLTRRYGGVSHKSDVYSYGMLILEMIGARKSDGSRGSHTSEVYFPDPIYKDLEQGNIHSSCLLISVEENEIVRKMTMVSLWCIQTNPTDRPSMSKVIEMLEGPLQSVSFPPKPASYSPNIAPLQFSEISSSNIYLTNSITIQKDVLSN